AGVTSHAARREPSRLAGDPDRGVAMAANGTKNPMRDEPMGQLFRELSNDLSTLVRQELRLAQAEMTEKGKRLGVGAGLFGGAGVVGLLALGSLTACLIAALATGM